MDAPELNPSLDDAIKAIDGLQLLVWPGAQTKQLETLRQFLYSLDMTAPEDMRRLTDAEQEVLEGAYQAGFKVPDQLGAMLVVRTRDFLRYVARPVVREPLRWPQVLALAERHGHAMVRCMTHPNGPVTGYKFNLEPNQLAAFAQAVREQNKES